MIFKAIMASCESKRFFIFPTLSQFPPKILPTEPVFIIKQIIYNKDDLKRGQFFKESGMSFMIKNSK